MYSRDFFVLIIAFLMIVTIFFGAISCENKEIRSTREVEQIELYPEYTYYYMDIVPDSLKPQMATWITETVRAASNHMNGGDYEDPEDVLEEAQDIAEDLFERRVEGLYIKYSETHSSNFIPYYKLTPEQKIILNDIKEGRRIK